MPPHPSHTIPPEILSMLRQLRRRIRGYVLLEGTALVIALLGLLFWVSFGLDFAYFKLSHLELPRWFRATFGILVICTFGASFVAWVALRLLRSIRLKALALVLERRFPELDDRLITAVELAASPADRETPLTRSMLDRTIEEVTRTARTLDVGSVFEKYPLRRAIVLATLLFASIGGLAWANQEAFARWKRGYVDLQDVYWTRDYGLIVKVIAQPGDVIKPFRNLQYKHPRGDDLTLLIETAEGKKIPDEVALQYVLADGRGSGSVPCNRDGERTFKYSFGGQLDSMQFRVVGGDFTNREPYRVVVVDPPRVDSIVLDSFYPGYTGLVKTDDYTGEVVRDPVAVHGTQVSLPAETDFILRAQCNKPLVSVSIQFEPYELTFAVETAGDATPAQSASAGAHVSELSGDDTSSSAEFVVSGTLTLRSEEGKPERTTPIPPEIAGRFFAADRMAFSVPFVLSTAATDAALSRNRLLETPFGPPFVMPPDSLVRMTLGDIDDVVGSEPARLTINGTVDQPPLVQTALKGVGIGVTRKALIPVTGTVTDDYGIESARFEFRIDDQEEWQSRSFVTAPRSLPKQFTLKMSDEQEFERFEVLPLDVQIGQKLSLSVVAADGDNLNGPHKTRGETYAFNVVSNEQLLSMLYEKELNLRKRFERIITEVQETQKDLILHRTRVEEQRELQKEGPQPGKEAEHRTRIEEISSAVTASAERALHAVGKNANETAAVERSFQDIREELVNNAVDTPQMLERIDDHIVAPLSAINTHDFPAVDEALFAFKRANENNLDPIPTIDAAVDELTAMLSRMEQVLLEMRKLETFQEALELLKGIIADEEELAKKTDAERKKALIKKLRESGLNE